MKCSGAFAVSINRGQGRTFPFMSVQWFELPFSKCWSHTINPLQPWFEETVCWWGHKCFRRGIQGGKLNNGNVNRPFITHPIHHYLISLLLPPVFIGFFPPLINSIHRTQWTVFILFLWRENYCCFDWLLLLGDTAWQKTMNLPIIWKINVIYGSSNW